jgi:anti-anti-sigma regulatory factor
MPVTQVQEEPHWLIRLDGQINLTSATELKTLLLDWLASGKDLELDLERVEEIDIAILQLLWAAGREAAGKGAGMVGRLSEAAAMAARDAGFDRMPGLGSRSDW